MQENKRGIKIKKINGNEYAYDTVSYWDKENKRYRKKSVYLGKITNPETKAYIPKNANAVNSDEELIMVFGDSYSIAKTIENSIFGEVISGVIPKESDTLMSLICYKLLKSSSMQYAQSWAKGNFVSRLFKASDLSSQRISDFLKKLGNESVWRKFFKS